MKPNQDLKDIIREDFLEEMDSTFICEDRVSARRSSQECGSGGRCSPGRCLEAFGVGKRGECPVWSRVEGAPAGEDTGESPGWRALEELGFY